MSVPVIHESEVEELDLPGRRFRWLVAEDRIQSKYSSVCVIRVKPGARFNRLEELFILMPTLP